MDSDSAQRLLQKALGDPAAQFREGQWQAIDAVANRRKKVLVVQRTGWGKSSVYFISTRILRDRGAGPTLIVSPLLALMRNQLEAASALGIRAERIDSSNRTEWDEVKAALASDEVDVLFVSPERFANSEFVDETLATLASRVGLLVVDEAHCISDWGHDFRPDYKRIVNILKRLPPNTAFLATTATANDRVVEDIEHQLGDIEVLRGSLVRETLALQNLHIPHQADRLAWLARTIPSLPGTGIVYTLTKHDATQVAQWLQENEVSAKAYYSGVQAPDFDDSNAYRVHLESELLENRVKALVATSALGMGYDKPDLGFVIHYQMPGSVVAYYQQVGRAGRAIERAYGILLSGDEDGHIHEYFRNQAFPREADVTRLLRALDTSNGLSTKELEFAANLRSSQIQAALKYLDVQSPSPVLFDRPKWRRTVNEWTMPHADIARLTEKKEVEWREMQAYLRTRTCLMNFLQKALNDSVTAVCGKCAVCIGSDVVPTKIEHRLSAAAMRFLRRSELSIEPRKQVSQGGFTEYEISGKLGTDLRAEEGRVLSRWGDAGWGKLVGDDKKRGHFRDELVEAVAEMIEERWSPQPRPQWVTCVPSLRQPGLVPDFARRLSIRLGLRFVDAIVKVRDNEAQKIQQNEYHQCRNLDGVFEVHSAVSDSPVLLVDDMVDSRWTLTVLAVLLRRAGAGEVFPVCLASTAHGG